LCLVEESPPFTPPTLAYGLSRTIRLRLEYNKSRVKERKNMSVVSSAERVEEKRRREEDADANQTDAPGPAR